MKRVFVVLFLFFCVCLNAHSEDLKATLQDIISLAQNSVSDETIIAYLETREINFGLGAKEILELKNSGVSENVIRYLLERMGTEESKSYIQPHYYGGYSYGASLNVCGYGSAFAFSFSTFPFYNFQPIPTKNYFQMNGHNYFRHKGHFHLDDSLQFASFSQSAPEKDFHAAAAVSWGSRKFNNVGSNSQRSGSHTHFVAGNNHRGSSVKSRSYGSFKNGTSKAGNSWGSRSGKGFSTTPHRN